MSDKKMIVRHIQSGEEFNLIEPLHVKFKGEYGYMALTHDYDVFFFSEYDGVNSDRVTNEFEIIGNPITDLQSENARLRDALNAIANAVGPSNDREAWMWVSTARLESNKALKGGNHESK